jgi:hypothetical protein
MTVDLTRLAIGRAVTSIDAQLAGGPWFKPGIDLAQLTRN